MRLLNAMTKRLEEFADDEIPPYAILSHTWGRNEVQFREVEGGLYVGDSVKIESCCNQALEDGIDYVWIDTCCIDKRSSAELSEAINSMFAWYQRSKVCYAYLVDVSVDDALVNLDASRALSKSRWFTRGWTLQELLAPSRVVFYNTSWATIGEVNRSDHLENDNPFATLISVISGIPIECFGNSFYSRRKSVAQRMSWAAHRQTTRVEDIAYSLMGIFNINMPLLYGEKGNAFCRLQKEILSSSDGDETLLAWGFGNKPSEKGGLLARSPPDFANCENVIPYTPNISEISHFSMTNLGLHICMKVRNLLTDTRDFVGLLNCSTSGEKGLRNITIPLTVHKREDGAISMKGPFSREGEQYPCWFPYLYSTNLITIQLFQYMWVLESGVSLFRAG
jgi:hypothetical protein